MSNDLSQINLTLKLPIGFRALQAEVDFDELLDEDDLPRQLQSLKRINSGESFSFRVTDIKNPFSFMPTDEAIQYTVYTFDGFMIENMPFSDKLRVNNTVRGDLDPRRSSARPNDF